MPIEKNIPKLQQSQQEVPESLAIRKQNYEDAGYTYTFSPKEKNYIKYNTLRNKRKQTELLDVIKIYYLKDENEGKEYDVWYQNSKCKDFNGNMQKSPITEVIGVADAPQTDQIKDEDDNVTDIVLVETHNYYYKEHDPEFLKELFNKSRNSGNIACYVGYTRNPKTGSNDFINNKKYIKNQKAFMEKSFDELMDLPDGLNKKIDYKAGGNNSSKKQLKHSSVKKAMVNTNQPEDIEKRVKDNGQLYPTSTEELTKNEQFQEKVESGEDGEETTTTETKTSETKTAAEERPGLKVGSGSNSSSGGSGSSGGGSGTGSGSSHSKKD